MAFKELIATLSKLLKDSNPNSQKVNDCFEHLLKASIKEKKYFTGADSEIFNLVLQKKIQSELELPFELENYKFSTTNYLKEQHELYFKHLSLIISIDKLNIVQPKIDSDFGYLPFLNKNNLNITQKNIQDKVILIESYLAEKAVGITSKKFDLTKGVEISYEYSKPNLIELYLTQGKCKIDDKGLKEWYNESIYHSNSYSLYVELEKGSSIIYGANEEISEAFFSFEFDVAEQLDTKTYDKIENIIYDRVYFIKDLSYRSIIDNLKQEFQEYLQKFELGTIKSFINRKHIESVFLFDEVAKHDLVYYDSFGNFDFYSFKVRHARVVSYIALYRKKEYLIEETKHFYKTVFEKLSTLFHSLLKIDSNDLDKFELLNSMNAYEINVDSNHFEEEDFDSSFDAKLTEKLILLSELGVIEFLRTKDPFKSSTNRMANCIATLIGEKHTSVQSCLNPIMNPDSSQKNNPLESKTTVLKIRNYLIELGYKPTEKG